MTGIVEWILESLWVLVFIYLKKAFDTVDKKKLEVYGVQQSELSWFKSYLTNRKQFCRVNGVDSEVGDIEVGVPQGSCSSLPRRHQ